jgi:HSP20 family protein
MQTTPGDRWKEDQEEFEMPATRWDPLGDMVGLRDAMDRLMNDAFVRPARALTGNSEQGGEFGMPIDVAETEDSYTVKAVMPGVKADNVDINITGDVLTIRGETRTESEEKQANYHRREIRFGTYARSLQLPTAVQSDRAEATFEDGVLTLTLPKVEEVKPKQIKIQARSAAIPAEGGASDGQ